MKRTICSLLVIIFILVSNGCVKRIDDDRQRIRLGEIPAPQEVCIEPVVVEEAIVIEEPIEWQSGTDVGCIVDNVDPSEIEDEIIIPFSASEMGVTDSIGLTQYTSGYRNLVALSDLFSPEVLDFLYREVEAETGLRANVECKSHVASVIFNRMEVGYWGTTIREVLTYPDQFKVVTTKAYLYVTPTAETIQACEIAWFKDTAQGALFFNRHVTESWAKKHAQWIFKDEIDHDFYR